MTDPDAGAAPGTTPVRGTYYLRTFGCQMNEHDAERIRAMLEEEGLRRVAKPDEADVLVYNTCTVRHSADERLAGHLGMAARLKRDDPGRLVVVTGCLPQAEQAGLLRTLPLRRRGPRPAESRSTARGLARRPRRAARRASPTSRLLSGRLPGRRERPFQAWLQVMAGCTNFCSYCIVPFVRGPERSRPLPERRRRSARAGGRRRASRSRSSARTSTPTGRPDARRRRADLRRTAAPLSTASTAWPGNAS